MSEPVVLRPLLAYRTPEAEAVKARSHFTKIERHTNNQRIVRFLNNLILYFNLLCLQSSCRQQTRYYKYMFVHFHKAAKIKIDKSG